MPSQIHIHVAKAHQADQHRHADARRRAGASTGRPPDEPDPGAAAPAGRAAALAAVRRAQRKLARQATA